jgi:hypothetical protein
MDVTGPTCTIETPGSGAIDAERSGIPSTQNEVATIPAGMIGDLSSRRESSVLGSPLVEAAVVVVVAVIAAIMIRRVDPLEIIFMARMRAYQQ